MALPLILTLMAVAGGVKGANSIGNGVSNIRKATLLKDELELKNKLNLKYYEKKNREITEYLENLGKKELEIFKSFEKFSFIIEQIQNKPEFKNLSNNNFKLPELNFSELKEISLKAGVFLSGLGATGVGIASGIATGGITTTLITSLGVASTGTAISGLSGVAATNALLAALGGGSIAVGGGGVALGTAVLSGATLGIGVFAGGYLFEKYSDTLIEKMEEVSNSIQATAESIKKICEHYEKLKNVAIKFNGALTLTNRIYQEHLEKLYKLVVIDGKKDWSYFSENEILLVENTVLLVQLIYRLGKTKLLLSPKDKNRLEEINEKDVQEIVLTTKKQLVESGIKKE